MSGKQKCTDLKSPRHRANLPSRTQNSFVFSLNVSLSSTVSLETNSEYLVRCYIEADSFPDSEVIFLPFKDKLASKGILATNVLAKPVNKHFLIRLYNASDMCVTLYKNFRLGVIENYIVSNNVQYCRVLDSTPDVANHMLPIIQQIDAEMSLSSEQRSAAKYLITSFSDIFSKSSTDIGFYNGIKHEINTGKSRPMATNPRRIPIAIQDKVDKMIDELKEKEIIRESNSSWCSPIIIVPKKNGELRLCVDYRGLNFMTKRPIYPLPDSQQLFDSVAGATYFSTLDLSSGYYNVEVQECDKEKTAFSTRRGQWEFNRLPFGLSGAPATFQMMMNTILKKENFEKCLIYLDDVLIFAESFDSHLLRVKHVLERIRDSGVKLSPKKCSFFKKSVTYLGHVLSERGIETDPHKIEKVKNYPAPSSLKELRQFCGFANYYRKFIKNYSQIMQPLEQLLKSNDTNPESLIWTDNQANAFKIIKEKLVSAPVLCIPNNNDTFILDTDACYFSMGAVLSQVQNGEEKVVAYASKKFSNSQIKYCVTRKELLSVYTFVKQFHHYLFGRHFIIRTDHKALSWMLNWKKPSTTQYCQWITELEIYDFDICHRPGTKHVNADFLSRIENCGQCELKHREPKAKRNVKNLEYVKECNEGHARIIETQVLTEQEKFDIIRYCHDSFGHLSAKYVVEMVKKKCQWKSLKRDVENYINDCQFCAERKIGRPLESKEKHFSASKPFEIICLDIVGPLPEVNGYKYILGIVDVFSRYVKLIPLRSSRSEIINAKLLEHWIAYFGIPSIIHSDNGKQFRGELMKEFCKTFRCKQSFAMPYYHKGNAVIERVFKSIEDMVYATCKCFALKWPKALALVEIGMHCKENPSTKFSPHELVFGNEINIFPECGKQNDNNVELCVYLKQLKHKFACIQKLMSENFYNNKNVDSLEIGATVMYKLEGKCGIDKPRFAGPAKIKKQLPFDDYIIEVDGKEICRNINQLKLFKGLGRHDKNKLVDSNKQESILSRSDRTIRQTTNKRKENSIPTQNNISQEENTGQTGLRKSRRPKSKPERFING